MEGNYRLKEVLIGVVENQLRSNKPKATKETFERLLLVGYDETTAKERIASVIVEESYHMLKNKRVFDEKRFAEKLRELE